jgi:heat shock protein HtpX
MEETKMNTFKSFMLMLVMTLLLIGVGQLVAGRNGMITALAFAAVMNFISYWFSDKIVLFMYRAKELKETENPKLYSIVRNLTHLANLPMPKLYFINSPMPNAFATGRNPQHAAVAVTSGIMSLLNDDELTGVIAHELSHVHNRDILIGTIAATLAGAIFMLARMAQFAAIFGGGGNRGGDRNNNNGIGILVVAIVAPIAAMLIQMAISRSREFQADKSGAELCKKPLALASALQKLSAGIQRNPVQVNPTTAHMFIVSPFSGKSLFTLFSTHPPMEQRVKRLQQMAQEMSGSAYKMPNIIS